MLTVGVVHGSVPHRRAIEVAAGNAGRCIVLWSVGDGALAAKAMRDQPPQLVLVDCNLEGTTAVELIRGLPRTSSALLLSDGSAASNGRVYDGMAAGALDVATCPAPGGSPRHDAAFLAKLKSLEAILPPAHDAPMVPGVAQRTRARVVLIGCSTGGPQALATVLGNIPVAANAAIVIAQHVDAQFSDGLVEWLTRDTGMSVRIAAPDGAPEGGVALLAGTNDHLVATARRRLAYTPHPRDVPYRPSADALFSSFAEHWEDPGVAVLLTGIGRDGAQGLLALRRAGWHTIAQDAATSVVFGMPKAAIALGAACEVLPLPAIAGAITKRLASTASAARAR